MGSRLPVAWGILKKNCSKVPISQAIYSYTLDSRAKLFTVCSLGKVFEFLWKMSVTNSKGGPSVRKKIIFFLRFMYIHYSVIWKQKHPRADFSRRSKSGSINIMLPEVLPKAKSEWKLSPHFTQRFFSIFPHLSHHFPNSLFSWTYFPTFVSPVPHST